MHTLPHCAADGSRFDSLNPDDLDLHGYDPCVECDNQDIPGIAEEFFTTQDDRPFFLTASFLNPHDCVTVGEDLDAQEHRIGPMPTSLDDLPPLPANPAIRENEPSVVRQHWERHAVRYGRSTYIPYPTQGWDELHWRQYIWGYYRLIELVDSQVGLVLASLQKSGKSDDTVVIFAADHGDGAGHRGWNHAGSR